MNHWQLLGLVVLVQTTTITLLAALLIAIVRRSAARRQAVGMVALAGLVTCPVAAVVLPTPGWMDRILGHSAVSTVEEPAPLANAPLIREPVDPEARKTWEIFEPVLERRPDEAAALSNDPLPNEPVLVAPADAKDTPEKGEPVSKGEMFADHWPLSAWNICLLAWGVGFLVRVGNLLWREWSLRRLRGSLVEIDPSGAFALVVSEARERTGLEGTPLLAGSWLLPTPVILGIARPVVVLPRQFIADLTTEGLRDVLTHEFAHLIRRDPWIHLLQKIVGAVYWFHPGVHWLNVEISQSREELCDNFVLRDTEAAGYAEVLLKLAMRRDVPRSTLSLLGLFRRETLERRVAGFLRPDRDLATSASWKVTTTASMLLLAVTFAIGGTRAEDFVASEAGTTPTVELESTSPNSEAGSDSEEKITIRGVCRDEAGNPLSGVRLALFQGEPEIAPPFTSLKQIAEQVTGEDGRYEFADVVGDIREISSISFTNLAVAASKAKHASAMRTIELEGQQAAKTLDLELSSKIGTLSGRIRDRYGRPIRGATVFIQDAYGHPIPGVGSTVSDDGGRYAISDLPEWKRVIIPSSNPRFFSGIAACYFRVTHPNYALTISQYDETPQTVDVVLYPPALVEGQVIDLVTGKPIPDVPVFAQGIIDSGWGQIRTDQDGRYQFKLTEDFYNIWADVDERMPLAIKALEAIPGQRATADVRMVRGGFVTGRLLDGDSETPIRPTKEQTISIAQYGPARPRPGAAVTSAPIDDDGRFRLHVAPGRNYIYAMSQRASAWVDVGDGEEVELDLRSGAEATPDRDETALRSRLERQHKAKMERNKASFPEPLPKAGEKRTLGNPGRLRGDTPTGRLLNTLEELSTDHAEIFGEQWTVTMRDLIHGGSDAVPELIEELDQTQNDMMVRCVAFIMRGIGDKRAIPALIRAIPKTLAPSRSDMGLSPDDPELLRFMQQHDLDKDDREDNYGFGRSIREVFGSLNALTGQSFDEDELLYIARANNPHQIALQQKLFQKHAEQWAKWWEANWSKFIQDEAFSKVDLRLFPSIDAKPVDRNAKLSTVDGGFSGGVLESIRSKDHRFAFHDIDTGRFAGLPAQWREVEIDDEVMREITEWAKSEGFDLFGDDYVDESGKRVHAIRAVNAQIWQLEKERDVQPNRGEILADLQKAGRPTGDWLLHSDPATNKIDPRATASFLYVTADGTPAIIDIGVEVTDTSVKLGVPLEGDPNLDPVSFWQGRRFSLRILGPR